MKKRAVIATAAVVTGLGGVAVLSALANPISQPTPFYPYVRIIPGQPRPECFNLTLLGISAGIPDITAIRQLVGCSSS